MKLSLRSTAERLPAKVERHMISHILMFSTTLLLFEQDVTHANAMPILERTAESIYIKGEVGKDIHKDKSAWKACDATMHCIHLFISLLREYDGKKYQDGDGDDCSENESRFDVVQKCASLRLPA